MVPGDKSISHRAAMIAALAEGSSRITNFSTSVDCAATLACLEQLGVSIERDDGETAQRHPYSQRGREVPAGPDRGPGARCAILPRHHRLGRSVD